SIRQAGPLRAADRPRDRRTAPALAAAPAARHIAFPDCSFGPDACPGTSMSRTVFAQLAAYNSWANARLYGAALDLPDPAYRQDTGVFFGSLHRTLNHLVVADRIWLHRLTGEGAAPRRVDTIVCDALPDLARARLAEDARLETFVRD